MDRLLNVLQMGGDATSRGGQAVGVSIATWFLTSVFLVMFISGQIVKYVLLGRLWIDDYLMFPATALALGLSVTYSIASSNGLGNKEVSAENFNSLQKALYAADLLYIPTVCCIKLSLITLVHRLIVDDAQRRFIRAIGALTSLGTVATLVAASLQCQIPQTWEVLTLRCFNRPGFWIGFGVLDVVTDISIIIVAAALVWNVRMALSHKIIVVGCFAPRILVVAAAACRLAYLVPANLHQNPEYGLWISVVCAEIQVCLSVSTACIPSVKPLFEAIETGVWQADDLRRRGLSLDDLYSRGYLKEKGSWVELSSYNEGA